jgi:uncharacterized protein (DUF1330 family)
VSHTLHAARRLLVALLPALWLAMPPAAPAADAAATPPAAIETTEPARKGYLLFRSRYADPEALMPYGRAVVPLAAKFGGRFIAIANAPEPVEGTPDTRRVVIIEFPTLAAARAFWTSPEYAEVKQLREALPGEIDAILFEGR